MQRCDIAGGILSAVFQQVVAAHAERLGQLGDLIIRHEPNALFNAQNGVTSFISIPASCMRAAS